MSQFELIMNHLNDVTILPDSELEAAFRSALTIEEKKSIANKIVDLIKQAKVSDSGALRAFLLQNQIYISIDSLTFDEAKLIISYLSKQNMSQTEEPNFDIFTKLAIKDAIKHKQFTLVNNLLSLNRKFKVDNELMLFAQQNGYSGLALHHTLRALRWHRTETNNSPEISDTEWSHAEKLFEKLKEGYKDNPLQEFCIKISRKTDADLKRSFICQRSLMPDGKYQDKLYALSRGSVDMTTLSPHTEGILGFGGSAVAKIAVTRDGEKKVYRVSNKMNELGIEDSVELKSITGSTSVIQGPRADATSKPWILKGSSDAYKSRELQPLHDGVTLNAYLSDNASLNKNACLKVIKVILKDLQERFHRNNWAHKDLHGNNVILNINANNEVERAVLIDTDNSMKLAEHNAEKIDTPRFIMMVQCIINSSDLKGTNVAQYVNKQAELVHALVDEADANKYHNVPKIDNFIAKISELAANEKLKL